MDSACVLPSLLLDESDARMSIFQLSNSLGIEMLDACIELIAIDKTELKVLSFLLKGRVYPVDLWEIVWERTIEAKQETVLREHQSICVGAFNGKRHAVAEHILMEEKKKRGQMEVSLYSQALEHLQQHQMLNRDVRSPSATSNHTVAHAPLTGPTATQEKCEAWLKRRHANFLSDQVAALMESGVCLDGSTSSLHGFGPTQASASLNSVGASLPLLSTWVTANIQEAFYHAFHAEQAYQTGLMPYFLAANGNHFYHRNIEFELLTLQAKMRRAQAEIELYTVAIENAREFNFPDNTGTLSWSSGFIPPPRPDELCYYYDDDDDCDDVTDDFGDF